MLRLRLVKDSRIIQISGKMLIASSSAIVGATNSHAMARSDRPWTRRPARDFTGLLTPGIVAWSGWRIVVSVSISGDGRFGFPEAALGESSSGEVWAGT